MTRLNKFLSAKLAFCVAFVFIFNTIIQSISYAEIAQVSILALPAPNQMLKASANYSEPVLRGLKLDRNNPYKLDFIIDTQSKDSVSQAEVENLVKYFLAGLSIANEDIWVNLSPFEKDRILADSVAKTELGKDILIQDYVLKQFSSSITDPQTDLGKKYWSLMNSAKVTDATALLNKIWISPDNAEVFQKDNVVLITKADLKVETAKDHMAEQSNGADLSNDLKDLILPVLSDEVNNGQSFTKLRQIFHSLILAKWFKESLHESVYKSYFDSESTSAIESSDVNIKSKVFESYVKSFQDGVYKSILKEKTENNKLVKRQYFCGGAHMNMALKQRSELPSEFITVDDISTGSSAVASISVMSSSIDVQTKMQINHIKNFAKDTLLDKELLKELGGKELFHEFMDLLKYINKGDENVLSKIEDLNLKMLNESYLGLDVDELHESVEFVKEKFDQTFEVKKLEKLLISLLLSNMDIPSWAIETLRNLRQVKQEVDRLDIDTIKKDPKWYTFTAQLAVLYVRAGANLDIALADMMHNNEWLKKTDQLKDNGYIYKDGANAFAMNNEFASILAPYIISHQTFVDATSYKREHIGFLSAGELSKKPRMFINLKSMLEDLKKWPSRGGSTGRLMKGLAPEFRTYLEVVKAIINQLSDEKLELLVKQLGYDFRPVTLLAYQSGKEDIRVSEVINEGKTPEKLWETIHPDYKKFWRGNTNKGIMYLRLMDMMNPRGNFDVSAAQLSKWAQSSEAALANYTYLVKRFTKEDNPNVNITEESKVDLNITVLDKGKWNETIDLKSILEKYKPEDAVVGLGVAKPQGANANMGMLFLRTLVEMYPKAHFNVSVENFLKWADANSNQIKRGQLDKLFNPRAELSDEYQLKSLNLNPYDINKALIENVDQFISLGYLKNVDIFHEGTEYFDYDDKLEIHNISAEYSLAMIDMILRMQFTHRFKGVAYIRTSDNEALYESFDNFADLLKSFQKNTDYENNITTYIHPKSRAIISQLIKLFSILGAEQEEVLMRDYGINGDDIKALLAHKNIEAVKLSDIIKNYSPQEYLNQVPDAVASMLVGNKDAIKIINHINVLYPDMLFDVSLDEFVAWGELNSNVFNNYPKLITKFRETSANDVKVKTTIQANNFTIKKFNAKLFKEAKLSTTTQKFARFTAQLLEAYDFSGNFDEVQLGVAYEHVYYDHNGVSLIKELVDKGYLEPIDFETYKINDKMKTLIAQTMLTQDFAAEFLNKSNNFAAIGTTNRNVPYVAVSNIYDFLIYYQSLINGVEIPVVVMRDEFRHLLHQLNSFMNFLDLDGQNLVLAESGIVYSTIKHFSERNKHKAGLRISNIINNKTVDEAYELLNEEEKSLWLNYNKSNLAYLQNIMAKYDDIVFDVSFAELALWTGADLSTLEKHGFLDKYIGRAYAEKVNSNAALSPFSRSLSKGALNEFLQDCKKSLENTTLNKFHLSDIDERSLSYQNVYKFMKMHGFIEHIIEDYYKINSTVALHIIDMTLRDTYSNSLTRNEANLAFMRLKSKADTAATARSYSELFSFLREYQVRVNKDKHVAIGVSESTMKVIVNLARWVDLLDANDRKVFIERYGIDTEIFKKIIGHKNEMIVKQPMSQLVEKQTIEGALELFPKEYRSIFGSNSKDGVIFWTLMNTLFPNAEFDISHAHACVWSNLSYNNVLLKKMQKEGKFISEESKQTEDEDHELNESADVVTVAEGIDLKAVEESLLQLLNGANIQSEDLRAIKVFMGEAESADMLLTDTFKGDNKVQVKRLLSRNLISEEDGVYRFTEQFAMTAVKMLLTQKSLSSKPYAYLKGNEEIKYITMAELLVYVRVNENGLNVQDIVLSDKAKHTISLLNSILNNLSAAETFRQNLKEFIGAGINEQFTVYPLVEQKADVLATATKGVRSISKPSLSELMFKAGLLRPGLEFTEYDLQVALLENFSLDNVKAIFEKQGLASFDVLTRTFQLSDHGVAQMLRYIQNSDQYILAYPKYTTEKPITSVQKLFDFLKTKHQSVVNFTPWGKQLTDFISNVDEKYLEDISQDNLIAVNYIRYRLDQDKIQMDEGLSDLDMFIDSLVLEEHDYYQDSANELESKLLLILETYGFDIPYTYDNAVEQIPEIKDMKLFTQTFMKLRSLLERGQSPEPTRRSDNIKKMTEEAELVIEELKTVVTQIQSDKMPESDAIREFLAEELVSNSDFQLALASFDRYITRLNKFEHGDNIVKYLAHYIYDKEVPLDYKIVVLGSLNHWLSFSSYDAKDILEVYKGILANVERGSDTADLVLSRLKTMRSYKTVEKSMYNYLLSEYGSEQQISASSSVTLENFSEFYDLDIEERKFKYFTEAFLKAYLYSGDLNQMPLGRMIDDYYYTYDDLARLLKNMEEYGYLNKIDESDVKFSTFKVNDNAIELVAKFILSKNYMQAVNKHSVTLPSVYIERDGTIQTAASFAEFLDIVRELIQEGKSFRVALQTEYKKTLGQLYGFLKDVPQELRLVIFGGNDNLEALKHLTVDYYNNKEKLKLSSLYKQKTVYEVYESMTEFDKRKLKRTNEGITVFDMLLSKYDLEFDISIEELREWLGISHATLKNYSLAGFYSAKKYNDNLDASFALPAIESVSQGTLDTLVRASINGLSVSNADEFIVLITKYSSEERTIKEALDLFYEHGYLKYLRDHNIGSSWEAKEVPVVSLESKFAIHMLEQLIVDTEIDLYSTAEYRLAFMHVYGEQGDVKTYKDLYTLLLDFQSMISQGKKVVFGLSNDLQDNLLKLKIVADALETDEQELLFKRLALKSTIFETILNYDCESPFPQSLSELMRNNNFDEYWKSIPDAYQTIYRTNSSSKHRFWDLLARFENDIKFDVTYDEAREWCQTSSQLSTLNKFKNRFKGGALENFNRINIEEIEPKKEKVVFTHKDKADYELLSLPDALTNYTVNEFNDLIPDSFAVDSEWSIPRKVVHFLVDSYQTPLSVTDQELADWLGVKPSVMLLYIKDALYKRKSIVLGESKLYSDIFMVTKESLKESDHKRANEVLRLLEQQVMPKSQRTISSIDQEMLKNYGIDVISIFRHKSKLGHYLQDILILMDINSLFDGIHKDLVKLYSDAGYQDKTVVALKYLIALYKDDLKIDYKELASWANIKVADLVGTVLKDDIDVVDQLFDNYRNNVLELKKIDEDDIEYVYWFSEHCDDQKAAYDAVLSYYGLSAVKLRELDPILFSRTAVDNAKMFVVTENETLVFIRVFDFLYYMLNNDVARETVVAISSDGAQYFSELKKLSESKDKLDALGVNFLMSFDETMENRSLLEEYGHGEFVPMEGLEYDEINETSFAIPGIISKYIEDNFTKNSKIKFLHYLFMTRHSTRDLDVATLSYSLKIGPESIIDFINKFYPNYSYLIDDYNKNESIETQKPITAEISQKNEIKHDVLFEIEFSPLVDELYQAYLVDQDILLDRDTYGSDIVRELTGNIISKDVDEDRRLTSLDLLNYWLISANYNGLQIYEVYSNIFENLEYENEFIRELLLRVEFLEGEEFTSIYELAYSMFKEVKLKNKKADIGGVDFDFAVEANTYQLPRAWQAHNKVDLSNIDFVVSSLYPVDSLSDYLQVN